MRVAFLAGEVPAPEFPDLVLLFRRMRTSYVSCSP